MEHFFSHCGEYLGYNITISGTRPTRKFQVNYSYEYGNASFDGKEWTYTLDTF